MNRSPLFAACVAIVAGWLLLPHAGGQDDEIPDDGPVLTVVVSNVPAPVGELRVGVFDSAETFTKVHLEQSPKIVLSEWLAENEQTAETFTGTVVAEVRGLPPGRYALSVYLDANANGELDKKIFGIPTEPFAFSNNPEIPRGVPPFDACVVEFAEEDLEIEIRLKTR